MKKQTVRETPSSTSGARKYMLSTIIKLWPNKALRTIRLVIISIISYYIPYLYQDFLQHSVLYIKPTCFPAKVEPNMEGAFLQSFCEIELQKASSRVKGGSTATD